MATRNSKIQHRVVRQSRLRWQHPEISDGLRVLTSRHTPARKLRGRSGPTACEPWPRAQAIPLPRRSRPRSTARPSLPGPEFALSTRRNLRRPASPARAGADLPWIPTTGLPKTVAGPLTPRSGEGRARATRTVPSVPSSPTARARRLPISIQSTERRRRFHQNGKTRTSLVQPFSRTLASSSPRQSVEPPGRGTARWPAGERGMAPSGHAPRALGRRTGGGMTRPGPIIRGPVPWLDASSAWSPAVADWPGTLTEHFPHLRTSLSRV